MPDAERVLWLTQLRSQNPEICAGVEALLREQQVLVREDFMASSPLAVPELPTLSGRNIGRYRLLSEIGRGGTGTVWLATRNDGRFERRVAVKLLGIACLGQASEERFRREGRILAHLAHPHIAELIDAGVSAGGQPYLMLEYIEGDPIDSYCDHRTLNIGARVRLFLDVLLAVSHAHRNLIVHRDIKPSNVLVRRDGHVKLLDFGIAKLLTEDGETGAAGVLTIDGGWPMTPEYAAPEQLSGEAVTTGTDVGGGAKQSLVVTIPPANPNNNMTPTGTPIGMVERQQGGFPSRPGAPSRVHFRYA